MASARKGRQVGACTASTLVLVLASRCAVVQRVAAVASAQRPEALRARGSEGSGLWSAVVGRTPSVPAIVRSGPSAWSSDMR